MKQPNPGDLSGFSMLELFQVEAENQANILTHGLLELEREPAAARHLEALMRAAHSLKGAARIVNFEPAVSLAHAMEDCFVAAQHGKLRLQKDEIDILFKSVDLLLDISRHPNAGGAGDGGAERVQDSLAKLQRLAAATTESAVEVSPRPSAMAARGPDTLDLAHPREHGDRALRVTAENLNRLLGLAGESMVESRWLHPFADSMQRLKRLQADIAQSLRELRDSLEANGLMERAEEQVTEVVDKVTECRQFLNDRLVDLELYDRRSANLSHRLYQEVLQCRMRPFGDGVRRFPRMVRDLARSLGKEARLEILGEHTQVDRDILEKLEAPLAQLLRNAVDHGCETPAERLQAGKPAEGIIRLEARHSAGMLVITVSDDGPGIRREQLREAIVQKRLINRDVVEKLSETELLEFLLLPGFTMRDTVTEISGRGVGLDVVQTMAKGVRGNVRITSQPGHGMRFQLHLPLTLSVLRTMLVEVAGEPYAIPLSQITRALKLPHGRIETMGGQHYFAFRDQQIALVTAHQVLELGRPPLLEEQLPVVILGDRATRYGLVVDRFLGERELVVQALDHRLGKVPNISAGSLMEDGSPVLILDVEDTARSIEKLISGGAIDQVRTDAIDTTAERVKRILAVDDSLTVREMERKLLNSRGYFTEVAVDGMDAWNAVRTGRYDLVITDVDMPRMDGIELAAMIKQDTRLKSVPVIIVSYKDREEDRLRGLEAGADYYLAKGSFHDETLLQAVVDLIGEAAT